MKVTEGAFERVKRVIDQEPEDFMLRVYVQGGGCSGFQYGFSLTEDEEEGDTVVTDGVTKVLIDPMSMMYLEGATLDYKTGLEGEMFIINNPNATTKCGCGSSFGV